MDDPQRLTLDDQIRLAHELALSYWGNPRNFEYPHRRTVELKARKIAGLLSPLNRCSVSSEYNFWRWIRVESDDAPDLVADFNDGISVESGSEMGDEEAELGEDGGEPMVDESFEPYTEDPAHAGTDPEEGVEGAQSAEDAMSLDSKSQYDAQNSLRHDTVADISFVSTASTVRLGNIHFRACDVAIFYTHLPRGLPAEFSLERKWHDIPLALIEIKRNVSRKLMGKNRMFSLDSRLEKAKIQIGQQADLIFQNHRYEEQKFVIGIAMVAEAWCYAEFWRDDRPKHAVAQGDTKVNWILPEGSWSPVLFWGSDESEAHVSLVTHKMKQLILSCGLTPVL